MNQPSNPYAALPPQETTDQLVHPDYAPMVNQVLVLGILQIAVGVLELVVGGGMVFLGFFMNTVFEAQQAEGIDPPPELMEWWISGFYWVFGGFIALFALLRIGSGLASFWFRGRVWMLVSVSVGLASAMTCYCAPFSIGLFIYGLILMLNPGVSQAYRMAREGLSPGEIKQLFAQGPVSPGAS